MITSGFPMALSVRQPWAWLIVNGHSDVLNQGFETPFRGRVLIHAGKKIDLKFRSTDWNDIKIPNRVDQGGIVGEAEITACVTVSPSRWFKGKYGFLLRNAKPLPFTRYQGRLGFFEVELSL